MKFSDISRYKHNFVAEQPFKNSFNGFKNVYVDFSDLIISYVLRCMQIRVHPIILHRSGVREGYEI